MTPLTWKEYTDHFEEWSESTRESYVSRLSDFGNHKDVAWYTANIYVSVSQPTHFYSPPGFKIIKSGGDFYV